MYKRAAGKIAFFQYLAVAVFLFLISGFWRLQIEAPELYSEQAERNRIKSLPILAPRGKILDRDGRVIVDNHSSFQPDPVAREPEAGASKAHRRRA